MKSLLIATLLFTGCTSGMYLRYSYNSKRPSEPLLKWHMSTSGMYLRYSYNRALENLPDCSKVHAINNEYITYSMIVPSTNTVYKIYTNYYRAYYTADGKIIKTTKN